MVIFSLSAIVDLPCDARAQCVIEVQGKSANKTHGVSQVVSKTNVCLSIPERVIRD